MKTRVIQGDLDEGGAAVIAAPRAIAREPGRRTGRIVGGSVAAVIGLGALAGGGALVGVHATQRDGDGFYATDGTALQTPTRALVSDALQVETDEVGWLVDGGRLADIRLGATGARDGPVFVGIGRTADVRAYLGGVSQETADFGDAAADEGARTPGTRAPARPASQTFWVESATGTGNQTIVWPMESGDWSAVVMNADGSAGVRVETGLGVRTNLVLWIGVGALVAGGLLAGAGTALIASGRRGPRRRQEGHATT